MLRAAASVWLHSEAFGPARNDRFGNRGHLTGRQGKGRIGSSLCEKPDRNETVGKLCTFPLRLTVKQDEEWDGA